MCGNKFFSTRKRNLCDDCVKKMIEAGYKNPALAVNMRKWKKSNPVKTKAYSLSTAINKRIKRGTLKASCLVCGDSKIEQHHHNYEKPRDVTFLCKPHHVALHSWDSN